MATWAKFKFFYKTMLGATGSTLTAGSTESTGDFDVDYIHNWLETNRWKADDTTSPVYLTLDLGSGNSEDADYIVILGHNLNTIGATVTLQYSTDNFSGDVNDAFTGEAPAADTVYVKEFTAPGAKRYWRLKISGSLSAAPYMALCVWGETTELDYASASFDPYQQATDANVGMSQGGYVTGVHRKFTERKLNFRIDDADTTLYAKVKSWWDDHAINLKNFFVGWETANNASDVWLMRASSTFHNPFTSTSTYRNLSFQLTGRVE